MSGVHTPIGDVPAPGPQAGAGDLVRPQASRAAAVPLGSVANGSCQDPCSACSCGGKADAQE